MAKARKSAAKKTPAKKKPVKAKAKPAAKVKPKAVAKPKAKQVTSIAASPDAIHVELGAKLASVRGDEQQERAAFASAIEAFMKLHASGQTATEVSCAEFLWEGDGANNPPIYARVADATMDETSRWFQFLVEEKQAYDARLAA